jgi:hypothetical protein
MRTGRRATDAQVKELRKALLWGASLAKAAMRAGMDRKTARKYRDEPERASQGRVPRTWRTRPDPLASVWPRLEELLAREPGLQARTLLDWLQREVPGRDWEQSRRTLERRVRQWKARHGPAKEVFFAQVHEPGRLGASDFTHMESLGVTIQGQAFPHLVYHFVLTWSNWEHVTVCPSESFASLSERLQNALWELGGVPQRHRTDRMTLAVHHEGNAEQYTAKYRALLGHYGLEAEATNPGSGHENGDCEQGHRRFKEAAEQALLLRGSRDFASRAAYVEFLRQVSGRRNAGRRERLAAERSCLRPLPGCRLEAVERQRVKVSRGSTIRVKNNAYSVPARLIGEVVEARVGAEAVEVWYAGELVQRMERLRGQEKHRIDYRHISSWLVRKPGGVRALRVPRGPVPDGDVPAGLRRAGGRSAGAGGQGVRAAAAPGGPGGRGPGGVGAGGAARRGAVAGRGGGARAMGGRDGVGGGLAGGGGGGGPGAVRRAPGGGVGGTE